MADIQASDVTYTRQDGAERIDNSGFRHEVYKIAFGDGSLTYPSGGVPLQKASLGMPNYIAELNIMDMDDASGWIHKWDYENNKIRLYQADYDATSDGVLIEASSGSTTPAAQALYVKVVGW